MAGYLLRDDATLEALTQQILDAVGEDFTETLHAVAEMCGMHPDAAFMDVCDIHDQMTRVRLLTDVPQDAVPMFYGKPYRGQDLTRVIDTVRDVARTYAHLLALRAPVIGGDA